MKNPAFLGLTVCACGLMLAAGAVAQGAAPTSATSSAPKGAKPKSPAEAQALQAISKLTKDPANTGAQMDAAITDFVTKFPDSDYISAVNVYGMAYYQNPKPEDKDRAYSQSLVYGEQALKADPKSLFAMVTLGDIIPIHVKKTDLDADQRLAEAEADDNQAIALVTTGEKINGKDVPPEMKNETEATAYASLARIAAVREQYQAEIDNYKKAIPFDDPGHQASYYFYTAVAQIELKQYTEASASLDSASKAAPTDPNVQAAVATYRKRLQALQTAH